MCTQAHARGYIWYTYIKVSHEFCNKSYAVTSGRNLAQISYGCTSPTLSEEDKYSTFVRTISSYKSRAPALAWVLQSLGWTRLSFLISRENLFVTTSNELTLHLAANNVTIFPSKTFEPGTFKDTRISNAALEEIKGSGVRVILVLAFESDIGRYMHEMYYSIRYMHAHVYGHVSMCIGSETLQRLAETFCTL